MFKFGGFAKRSCVKCTQASDDTINFVIFTNYIPFLQKTNSHGKNY